MAFLPKNGIKKARCGTLQARNALIYPGKHCMSKISLQDVEYVAGLAQLDLDDAAKARMAQEMSDILTYMDTLNSLNTDGVEPMMHAMPMINVFRDDVVTPSLPRDLALRGAPMHDDEYFMVPKILDAEGGGA